MKDRRDWKVRDVATPEPGFFMLRMVRGGPRLPARIRHEDGFWWAEVGKQTFSRNTDPLAAEWVMRIWHGGEDITATEHARRVREMQAAMSDRSHPINRPRQAIDLSKMKSLF